MVDLNDFFGPFSIGMKVTDFDPDNSELDRFIINIIKWDAKNGDEEAIRFLEGR
jgi:hypothetical protein